MEVDATVLIVIAALNEASGLPQTLEALRNECGEEAEVVVVDDGSTDETALFAELGGASLIRQEQCTGKCAAVMRGIRERIQPHHRAVVTCDADGQHQAEDVRRVLEALRKYDVVFTSRYRGDCPIAIGEPPVDRQFLNAMVTAAVERIVPWGLTDPVCGLRGFRVHIARWLLTQEFVTQGYGLELETVFRLCFLQGARTGTAPFSMTEIPIRPVYAGTPKMSAYYAEGSLRVAERSTRAADHLETLTSLMRAFGFHTIPRDQGLVELVRASGAHLRAVGGPSGPTAA
ncbi:glycosyltransferase family 2 protein [Candidatus Uhrbacteria bacterium]|nr:glycosyltransferase family 2 protein [Candidatus Uhrbacteria bacterium]